MGISAYLLFEKQGISLNDVLRNSEHICLTENLFCSVIEERSSEKEIVVYTRFNISDIPFRDSSSRQLCIDVYDATNDRQIIEFDWGTERLKFFRTSSVDGFCDNEDLLFKFLYLLLKIYPAARLWIEEDWFYPLENLDKIAGKPFDKEWCYKNPWALT